MDSGDESLAPLVDAATAPLPLGDSADCKVVHHAAAAVGAPPADLPACKTAGRSRRRRHVKKPRSARRAIVHLTAEYHGYARTGGLAEAVAGLAASQVRAGERVYVFVPLYASARAAAGRLEPMGPPERISIGSRAEDVTYCCDASRTSGPQVIFVDAPGCFDRPGLYGDDAGDYADNHVRFALFARAALHGIARFVDGPVLLHAHDWHAALAAVYMRTHPDFAERFAASPTVISVHNAGFQGHFGAAVMPELALPPELWHMDRLEWYGRLNLLKGALVFSDAAVTVSPAHAVELRTPEGGFGLHDTFRQLGARLVGICNGIELPHWDPCTDTQIVRTYSIDDLAGKAACKEALQRQFGLPIRADIPVIGMSSRLASQKGFDIVVRSERLRDGDMQLVIIGEGEPRLRHAVSAFVAELPGHVACNLTFTDALEHQLMAGADIVLMPSLYEPCGLTQMHAQRYGALVVGRRVGGIADTVEDGVTGFLFDAFDVRGMDAAIERALAVYADAPAWRAMMRRAMTRDFGWDHAVTDYAEVYRAAARTRRASTKAP